MTSTKDQWLSLGPAEESFILACLRPEKPVPTVPAGLDWLVLARRLNSDGLAPLVYWRFRNRLHDLPEALSNPLRHSYYQNVFANHLRLEELRRLGRSLALFDIPLLAMKGAAVALTVYPDQSLRFMGDLDVAVPPDRATTAVRLLREDGYVVDGVAAGQGDTDLLRQQGWHLRMVRDIGGKMVDLELHWPLRQSVLVTQVAQLNVAQLWATAVQLEQTNNLRQPAPALMLLHLCLHTGLSHRFTDLGLRHYVDLDRVVRRYSSDPFWDQFLAVTKAARAKHVAHICLSLSQSLLETPIPQEVMTALRIPQWKMRLLSSRLKPDAIINRRRVFYGRGYAAWRLITLDRALDLLGVAKNQLFPGREFLSHYYNTDDSWRLGLNALWYPFHSLARAGWRRWRLLIQQ